MKSLLIFFVIILFSCGHNMQHRITKDNKETKKKLFLVTNIDTINVYYFIYCSSEFSDYKIISQNTGKARNPYRIKEGRYYHFELTDFPDYSESDNPLAAFDPHVNCFVLLNDVIVCNEPEIQLCTTKNLKGLYYIPL